MHPTISLVPLYLDKKAWSCVVTTCPLPTLPSLAGIAPVLIHRTIHRLFKKARINSLHILHNCILEDVKSHPNTSFSPILASTASMELYHERLHLQFYWFLKSRKCSVLTPSNLFLPQPLPPDSNLPRKVCHTSSHPLWCERNLMHLCSRWRRGMH